MLLLYHTSPPFGGLFQFSKIVAYPLVDGKRYRRFVFKIGASKDVLHRFFNYRRGLSEHLLFDFINELVVNNQNQANPIQYFGFSQILLSIADRELDNVRGGALNRRVDRGALGHIFQKRNAGTDIGEIPAPAEESFRVR